MEFHQLRYFVAAAETGSMSRAAEREHVSQPALSRQVAQLEKRLGVQLFDRVKQRIRLSEAGRYFLPRARQLLCDAQTSEQQLRERFGGSRRTLRVGFVGPFLDDLVAPTVRELRREQRGLKVALFDLPPRAQLERLAARELDAAILGNLEAEHRQSFQVRALSRHRFALALPESHPLANTRSVELAAMRDEPFVSLDDAWFPGRRRFLLDTCAQAGFEPEVAVELDSVAMMLGAVAAGDGVALVPRHSEKLPHDGAVFVRIKPPVPVIELVLVTRRREPSDALDALHAALRVRARELADG
ncbi:MAG: LysR family transcriptional regulator [Planctomycetota bacterium]